MGKPLVVLFVRVPKYGAVKTRLAREIGAGEALRFYCGTLTRVFRRLAADRRFELRLAITPDISRGSWPARAQVAGQGGGDLGRRMVRALRSAGPRPAVVVGSDIPALSPAHIAQALAALGRAPFVLGPAADGGYWLIGARHPTRMRAEVLDGVRWSAPQTMQDTIARLGDVAVLEAVLDDVDDGAAYRRWISRSCGA